jgi:uncharacterized membrane protein YphA (DoxX/SURF4 family)
MEITSLIQTAAQLIVGLGILNVWLIRNQKATSYRGGSATSLKAEFATYGLPTAVFYLIGALKITAALALLIGIARQEFIAPAATVMAILMAGAISMHVKVHDPVQKSLPAVIMLLLCLLIRFL